jgi:hypothetical protein
MDFSGQEDCLDNGFIWAEGLASQWIYLAKRIGPTMDLSGH